MYAHIMHVIGRPQQAHGVRSPDEYRERVKRALFKHGLAPVLFRPESRPAAYISDGRWVCDCPCGNGPSVDPEWSLAICFECGAEYVPIIPGNYRMAEQVLLARPHPKFRHWFPESSLALQRTGRPTGAGGETVRELMEENVAREFPPRRSRGNS